MGFASLYYPRHMPSTARLDRIMVRIDAVYVLLLVYSTGLC